MSDLRGAKFAPSVVAGYVTETGGFYATLDAVPMVTLHDGEQVKAPHTEAVRQLLCDDPDDQRAIWRLAACALGTTQEISTSARFAWQWTTDIGHRWCLLVGHFDAAVIWEGAIDIDDISHATAALCLAIWGPK